MADGSLARPRAFLVFVTGSRYLGAVARKKLGEMLVDAGLLDQEQLRQALLEQRKWGRTLGRTLIEMHLVREEDLVQVLAAQFGMSTVDLDAVAIPQEVVDLVPGEIAIPHQVVPFAQPMKFLDVAVTDPANLAIVDELRMRTHLNVRPFLAGPAAIERALAKYYGHGVADVSFDMPGTYAAVPDDGRPISEAAAEREGMRDGLRPFRRGSGQMKAAAPQAPSADVAALEARIAALEAVVARDEQVLRQLLALLIEKGVATREEILERIK
jgi:type IV pilus assembly protein PilB